MAFLLLMHLNMQDTIPHDQIDQICFLFKKKKSSNV